MIRSLIPTKHVIILLSILISFLNCKQATPEAPVEQTIELSEAEKIAKAHGFDHWDRISKIEFTFNVDRDSTHFERSWSWEPKSKLVTRYTAKDTIQFNTASVDSTQIRADQGFINDKFWLLIPFQLVWDKGAKISESSKKVAPISGDTLNMMTIVYSDDGGYTPGDAYDIYYGDDYLIREWVYRAGNSETPSLTNTFENYKDYKGLKIATDHKKKEENWNLNFTGIKVHTDQ